MRGQHGTRSNHKVQILPVQKLSGQVAERKSHYGGSVEEDQKRGHKAACGGLNSCPLLSVMIQTAKDISLSLVIDKAEFFWYDVL